MNELQRTQAAYQHFTLEEWKLLARCVRHAFGDLEGTPAAILLAKVAEMLQKFPSASLD